MTLKYIFTAHYDDGGKLVQNEKDESLTGIGSAFSDVDQARLTRFQLNGGGHSYSVDLRDGGFTVNGLTFSMYDGQLHGMRLHYFRRNTVTFDGNLVETGQSVKYMLGWTAFDDKGNCVERVMEVD